jgi:hypothetical protein
VSATQPFLAEVWVTLVRVAGAVLGARHPDLQDAVQQSAIALVRALPALRRGATGLEQRALGDELARGRRSFLMCCVGLAGVAATAAAAPVLGGQKVRLAIVVAKDSPISDISFYDLKRLYQGEAVDANGKRLIPLNLFPQSEDRVRFDRAVLGLSPEDVSRYWIDRKIRGQSGAAKSRESSDLVKRVVLRVDGAIGYARLSELKPDVKVLRVDGKTPKDSGYSVEY